MRNVFLALLTLCLFSACDKEENQERKPKLIVTFRWDSTVDRQDNFGDLATIPAGNAAQSPDFEQLGIHFAGLYADKFTAFDQGVSLLETPRVTTGGTNAIEYSSIFKIEGAEDKLEFNLEDIPTGTYEYFRMSIAYQQYKIDYNLKGANLPMGISDDIDTRGTLTSFLGFNNYISEHTVGDSTLRVNQNKLQGYFAFQSSVDIMGVSYPFLTTGDAPQTTVPNPINATSPVPAGSCLVTGKMNQVLTIPANPTEDIELEIVVSINNSFEWEDTNANGKYEPLLNEKVVDMGTRGVFPRMK